MLNLTLILIRPRVVFLQLEDGGPAIKIRILIASSIASLFFNIMTFLPQLVVQYCYIFHTQMEKTARLFWTELLTCLVRSALIHYWAGLYTASNERRHCLHVSHCLTDLRGKSVHALWVVGVIHEVQGLCGEIVFFASKSARLSRKWTCSGFRGCNVSVVTVSVRLLLTTALRGREDAVL